MCVHQLRIDVKNKPLIKYGFLTERKVRSSLLPTVF